MPDAQVLGVVYTLSIDTAVFVIAFAYWLLRQRAARRVRRVSSRSDDDANELLDGPELEGDEAAVALQPLAEPAPAPAPAAAAAGNGAVDGSERDGARRASESEGSGGGDATATAAALAAEALSPSRLLARLFSPSAVRSVDGLVYLRFQQWSVVAVVALCVYGLLVLVPVFGSGDYVGIKETLLEHLSVGNIRLASPRLWAVFVGYLLVTAAGYALVAAFLADVKRSASRFPVHVMRLFMEPRTVHVFGMSRELVDGEAVRRFLHRVLPGQSESVQLALDVSDLSSLLTARASLRREIERCRAIEARSGRAQLRWCGRGSLLQHLMAREAELNRSIRDERLRPRRGSGHAFIVFRGAPAVDSLRSVFRAFLDDARDVRMRRGGTPEADDPIERDAANWRFALAPSPDDIIWDNLQVSRTSQWVRFAVANTVLLVALVGLIAPVTVLDYLAPLLHRLSDSVSTDNRNTFRILVTIYTPSLVVFLLNSILLPFLVERVADFERHHLFHERTRSVLHKNTLFLFVNTIVLPSFALNSVTALVDFALRTEFSQWDDVLGNLFVSSSGAFFISYVIHSGLLGSAAAIVDLNQALWRAWKEWRAVTPAELRSARERWAFDFGNSYSEKLTILGVIFIYACIVPLVLPAGLLFFALSHWADRHVLESGLYTVNFTSNGRLAATVARYALLLLAAAQFAASCLFAVQLDHTWYIVSGFALFNMVVTLALYAANTFRLSPYSVVDVVDAQTALRSLAVRFNSVAKLSAHGDRGDAGVGGDRELFRASAAAADEGEPREADAAWAEGRRGLRDAAVADSDEQKLPERPANAASSPSPASAAASAAAAGDGDGASRVYDVYLHPVLRTRAQRVDRAQSRAAKRSQASIAYATI